MMRSYHAGRRRLGVLCLFAAGLVAALWTVRRPVADLLRTQVCLLFSGRTPFATADRRAQWLEEHPDEIRLAFVGNWSVDAVWTNASRRAAFERALGEINAAGGVRGRRLAAEWFDAGRDGSKLQDQLMCLAGDPSYFAVLTGLLADPILSMKPILLQGRLIVLTPGVTNVRVTPDTDLPYLFVPNPSDADVAAGIADWVSSADNRKVVYLHGRSNESTGQAEELERVLLMRGVLGCMRIPFLDGWMWSEARDDTLRIRNYNGLNSVVLMIEGRADALNPSFLNWMLEHFKENVILTRPSFVPDDVKSDRILVPHVATAAEASYRSVYLLADALEKAPRLHPEAVVGTLRTSELKTPSGPFRFTDSRFEKVGKVVPLVNPNPL